MKAIRNWETETEKNANSLEKEAIAFIQKYNIKSRKEFIKIFIDDGVGNNFPRDYRAGLNLAVRRQIRKNKRQ